MEITTKHATATPDSVWAALRETDKQLKESSVKFDRELKESSDKFEREMKEYRANFEREKKEYDRRMKKMDDQLGAWANNHGAFAEEYFFNSFDSGRQNFFGEQFDRIEKNPKPLDYIIKDDYDIVMINGKSVAIIEVKFKAHENDIPKVIHKAKTFRVNYPRYAHHKIYLGLASMAFYPDVEQECINQGIALVKQVGDTVVIHDRHLRVF